MKEISISPSSFSELEICPRQYFLRYKIEASYPREVREYANEQELIERCIGNLLAGEGTVKQVVANHLEELDRVFQPDTVKEVIVILDNWLKERVLEGDLTDLNKPFVETFVLGRETVQINGLFHQIEKLEDGTIKATVFKGENRLYTYDWLIKSYLPLIYGLAIRKLYDADKIIISYFMVKHGSEVWVEFNREDWEYQKQLVAIQLKKLMEGGDDVTVVGSHCAYCPRKTLCNDYKKMIMESFEIRNIHELFNISMEEIVDYITILDAQKSLLKGRSDELKNILIQEMLENGKDHDEYGKYVLDIDQKKSYDYNVKKILKELKPKYYAKVLKIDRKKFEKYLDSLSDEDKMKLIVYCELKLFKPMLKIREQEEDRGKGKFKDLLHF